MRNRKANQGFTLIELLIVIAIIGILAAVLIPNLLAARERARDTAAVACGNAVLQQAEIFSIDNNGNYTGYDTALNTDDATADYFTGPACAATNVGDVAVTPSANSLVGTVESLSGTATVNFSSTNGVTVERN